MLRRKQTGRETQARTKLRVNNEAASHHRNLTYSTPRLVSNTISGYCLPFESVDSVIDLAYKTDTSGWDTNTVARNTTLSHRHRHNFLRPDLGVHSPNRLSRSQVYRPPAAVGWGKRERSGST